MPYSARDGLLLGAGISCVAGASLFYRRRQTLPFKVAYFLSWPILGSAIILLGTPTEQQILKRLEQGGADPQRLEAIRQQQRAMYQQMRQETDEKAHSRHAALKGAE